MSYTTFILETEDAYYVASVSASKEEEFRQNPDKIFNGSYGQWDYIISYEKQFNHFLFYQTNAGVGLDHGNSFTTLAGIEDLEIGVEKAKKKCLELLLTNKSSEKFLLKELTSNQWKSLTPK